MSTYLRPTSQVQCALLIRSSYVSGVQEQHEGLMREPPTVVRACHSATVRSTILLPSSPGTRALLGHDVKYQRSGHFVCDRWPA